jgi:hypothetical protein
MSRSTDRLQPPSEGNKSDSNRIKLEERCDKGRLLSSGTPSALRLRFGEDGVSGVAWSDKELAVSFSGNDVLYSCLLC